MTENQDNSFLADVETSAESANSLMAEVTEITSNWVRLANEISQYEDKLKELNAQERKISMEIIPGLFQQHGLTKLLLQNGIEVSVKEDIDAGIPADEHKAEQAFKWLASHGGADLIKDTLAIADPTQAIIELVSEQGLDFDRSRKVNANSLKAWLRAELGMKEGSVARIKTEDVCPEMRLFRYNKAKMKGAK